MLADVPLGQSREIFDTGAWLRDLGDKCNIMSDDQLLSSAFGFTSSNVVETRTGETYLICVKAHEVSFWRPLSFSFHFDVACCCESVSQMS